MGNFDEIYSFNNEEKEENEEKAKVTPLICGNPTPEEYFATLDKLMREEEIKIFEELRKENNR